MLKEGIAYSEIGDYNSAIKTLSQIIEKNPKHQEALFERAAAYFETGNFDLALEDYLASSFKPKTFLEQTEDTLLMTAALTQGIQEGALKQAVEFIPTLLASMNGMNECLWAFVQNPVKVSQDFVEAATSCVKQLRENTAQKNLEMVIPELKELNSNWDTLDPNSRLNQIGAIIGKYSVEIFGSAGTASIFKSFQALKTANRLLTFEAMAVSEGNKARIALEAAKRASNRQQILRSANLKIQMDKQGKHIVGHRNYEPIKNKSILEHPNPQKLVDNFAGKGAKLSNMHPGVPGYTECVDFCEFIGYVVNDQTGAKTATTWGKIHYAKDGVHVVPMMPRQ